MTGPWGLVGADGVLRLPKRRGDLIDEVNRLDRETFEANPGCRVLLRPYVPGEFFPATEEQVFPEPGERWVRVTLLGPGLRTRAAVVVPEGA